MKSRIQPILPDFGESDASAIKPADIDGWIAEHTKTAGTANRYRAVFSLVYREAVRNGRVSSNPARLVRQRKEGSGRIRYLLDEEEDRLCKTIVETFPEHMPELTIAVGTGMRKSDQYGLTWRRVDFKRNEVHLAKTKNGDPRDVPMSTAVLAAFRETETAKCQAHGSRVPNPRFPYVVRVRPRESWARRLSLARLPAHLLLAAGHGRCPAKNDTDTGWPQNDCDHGALCPSGSQHTACGR